MKNIGKYKVMIDIINAVKDEEEFLGKLEEIVECEGIESAISALKASGISVNTHESPNIKHKDLLNKSLCFIESKVEKNSDEILLKTFKEESAILNRLYKDFYSKKEHDKIKSVPDKYKLFAYLIVIENSLRILRNKANVDDGYCLLNIQFIKKDKNGIRSINELNPNEIINMHDKYIEDASTVLKAMLFYKYTYFSEDAENNCLIDEPINTDYMYLLSNHNDLVDILNIINDLHEKWRFGYISLVLEDNTIKSFIRDYDSIIENDLMDCRFESERLSAQFNNIDKFLGFIPNKNLIPLGHLDVIEFADEDYCKIYLNIKDFSTELNKIPLNQWIRAYTTMRLMATNFLSDNKYKMKRDLNSWVIITDKETLKENFKQNGISVKYIDKIIKYLTFNKKSRSIFSSPIIKVNGKLIIIPTICKSLSGAISLIELASSQQWDMSFKGSNFETFVRNQLNKANITNCSLKRYDEHGNEYECDVVFNLGKDLYFVECKNNIQPLGEYNKIRFKKEMEEHKQQIYRISKFYINNLDYVKERLNLPEKWKIRHAYNIILFSCKLGKSLVDNYNIVTDINILKSIILKEYPTIKQNGKPIILIKMDKYSSIYQGELTSTKLLKGIENPFQIILQNEALSENIVDVKINNLILTHKDNRKDRPEFMAVKQL